jgi:hypothetical protein
MQLDMFTLNPYDTNDKRISNEAWNNDHNHAEQDSRDLAMAVNLDDYAPDDDGEGCCLQNESNQELEPHEHYQMYETTADPTQQHELVTYEINFGDWDGLDTLSNEESEWRGSLCTAESLMGDDGGGLRTNAPTSHSVDNWSDLDHRAVSPSESPKSVQDARGSDTTPTAFIQGRSLLLGIEEPIVHSEGELLWTIKSVEHEVAAQLLKDHWLPQKL